MGFNLGWETKILHAEEQLSWHAATRESICQKERSHVMQRRSCMPQLRLDAAKWINIKKRFSIMAALNSKILPSNVSSVFFSIFIFLVVLGPVSFTILYAAWHTVIDYRKPMQISGTFQCVASSSLLCLPTICSFFKLLRLWFFSL